MKVSFHVCLISAVVLAGIVLILQRTLFRPPVPPPATIPAGQAALEADPAPNLMPSFSNLPAMAEQWQQRLATLPPKERKKSEARLEEEVKFFVSVQFLPPAERRQKMRERLEGLMNDPEIQAEWMDERMKMMARLTPEKRKKLFQSYVQYKKKVQSP